MGCVKDLTGTISHNPHTNSMKQIRPQYPSADAQRGTVTCLHSHSWGWLSPARPVRLQSPGVLYHRSLRVPRGPERTVHEVFPSAVSHTHPQTNRRVTPANTATAELRLFCGTPVPPDPAARGWGGRIRHVCWGPGELPAKNGIPVLASRFLVLFESTMP